MISDRLCHNNRFIIAECLLSQSAYYRRVLIHGTSFFCDTGGFIPIPLLVQPFLKVGFKSIISKNLIFNLKFCYNLVISNNNNPTPNGTETILS